jgi:uncharacterized protein YdhG (YjbR/CyaY superfamily)
VDPALAVGAGAVMRAAAKDIDGYLAGLPAEAQAALEKLRRAIRAAAPQAAESISYGMPAYKYRGKALAYFSAFTKHCSFFPASTAVIDAHRKELSKYSLSKGTIRLPPKQPLPAALVCKLVKARVAEIEAAVAARTASRRRAR